MPLALTLDLIYMIYTALCTHGLNFMIFSTCTAVQLYHVCDWFFSWAYSKTRWMVTYRYIVMVIMASHLITVDEGQIGEVCGEKSVKLSWWLWHRHFQADYWLGGNARTDIFSHLIWLADKSISWRACCRNPENCKLMDGIPLGEWVFLLLG